MLSIISRCINKKKNKYLFIIKKIKLFINIIENKNILNLFLIYIYIYIYE